MKTEEKCVADFEGPWVDPNFESGLIQRVRGAWHKPLAQLTNQELATLLRQRIGVSYLLPIAVARFSSGYDDDTEIYDGELEAAIETGKQKI
jgi:hypothetical protein